MGLFGNSPQQLRIMSQNENPTLPPVEGAITMQPKRGGLFGSGIQLRDVLGVLGDSLSVASGQEPFYTLTQQQRRQQDRALQLQALQQQQELARMLAVKQWERENPAPTDTQRNFEYYSGLDPAQRSQFDRMRAGDPYVTTTLPNKQIYSGPASGLGAALSGGVSSDDQPGEEDGYIYTPGPGGRGNQANWKLKGGPAGNGGGMFP